MAVALCISAIALGAAADWFRRRGIPTETLFGATAITFMFAQLAVVQRWPIPSYMSWALIAAAGAGTVLSYAILPGYFPTSASGRANSALNLLYLSVAFAVQWLMGVVVDQWPSLDGRHPVEAYQAAFGLNLAFQALAFGWFVAASVRSTEARSKHQIPQRLSSYRALPQRNLYRQAHLAWLTEVRAARTQVASWRCVAIASIALSFALTSPALPSTVEPARFGLTGMQQSFSDVAHRTGPRLPQRSLEFPLIPIAYRADGKGSLSAR